MVPPPDQNGLPAADVPAAPEAKLPESSDDAGRILTGKQEHCETLPLVLPLCPARVGLRSSLFFFFFCIRALTTLSPARPQTRAPGRAGQGRDRRAQLTDRPAQVRRPVQVRIRGGVPPRLRAARPSVHLRPPCARLSVPRQGEGEGVLAGKAPGGTSAPAHPRHPRLLI